MLYSLACSIEQVVVVGTLLVKGTEDIGFALNRMKLAVTDNQLQLIDELGTFQVVQFLQLISHIPPGWFFGHKTGSILFLQPLAFLNIIFNSIHLSCKVTNK